MWSQLCLKPSLKISANLDNSWSSSKELMLTLTPCHDLNSHETQASASSVQSHVEPPNGIPSAHIELIDLRLRFARCPTIESASLKRKRDGDSNGNVAGSGLLATSQRGKAAHRSYNPSLVNRINSSSQWSEARSRRAEMLEEDIETDFITSAPVSPIFGTLVDSQSSVSSQASLDTLIRKTDFTSQPLTHKALPPRSISFAELTKLVDCSLRGMIFNPKAISSSYLLSSTTNDPRLGQISPAVFSPGYMQV